jgi:predicted site-specific integrase-resolvase
MSENLTINEFAEKYRVCRATVANWRKKGLLHPLEVGGRVLITPAQEAAFIQQHSKGRHQVPQ